MHNINFSISNSEIRSCFFYILPDMRQYLMSMTPVITHTCHAKLRNLPAVIIVHLGYRHIKLIMNTRDQRFDYLPLLFQGVASWQVHCNTTGSYDHKCVERCMYYYYNEQADSQIPSNGLV